MTEPIKFREIDLDAFLAVAFGRHESASGSGDTFPCSRDVASFFMGRVGCLPDPERMQIYEPRKCFDEPFVFTREVVPCMGLLATDLEDLARQIRDRIELE